MARIIALQACRHGIGCSHLVANLAVIFMHHGYRVGLLDTDAQVGGIRTLFSLDETPEKDPNAYWWLVPDTRSTKTLRAEFRRYDTSYDTGSPGIYLSPLGSHFGLDSQLLMLLQQRYGEDKPFDILQQLGDELQLDIWLIDNQPDMSDDNLMGLSLADIAMVVLQLDPYDLQRAAVLLEVIEQLQITKTWLVPSLVLPTIETTVVTNMLENTYQHPVAGILYLSEEMMGLASQGVFCLHHPNHALTQTMIAIAQQLEQDSRTLFTSSASRK
ncbi:MAG: MinD/ParA family protein [Leptolyngbyaceae cyanobacterium]